MRVFHFRIVLDTDHFFTDSAADNILWIKLYVLTDEVLVCHLK